MTWLDELHEAQDRLREIDRDARDMANALHRLGLNALSEEAYSLSKLARTGLANLKAGITGKDEDNRARRTRRGLRIMTRSSTAAPGARLKAKAHGLGSSKGL